jgi:hypothetical protein
MKEHEYDELNLKKFKMESILPDATVLLLGKRRSGKCLLKGTKVLMSDGSTKKIEDIQIGDSVMGDDSKNRRVISTHNGYDTMYKITNQFNETYTVNSEHILSLKSTFEYKIKTYDKYYLVRWLDKNKLKIFTKKFNKNTNTYESLIYFCNKNSDEILNIPIKTYLNLPNKVKKFLYGYQKPIHFKPTQLSISPYLFGLLLNNSYMHTRNSKILKYLNKELPKYDSYLYYDVELQCYKINGKLNTYIKNFLNNNIPKVYIQNSRNSRIELLLAILEINNYFDRGFYRANIYENNHINDIIFIIKSVGFSIYKYQTGDYLNIHISCNNKFILKHEDLYTQSTSLILNKITIENVGINEYFGIEIDQNSLFMLDNCIVTHNSWLVRDIFYHHKYIPSGIVFSGTEEANPFFSEFIPDSFIHDEYDSELIEKIMNKQKKKINAAKKMGIKDGKCPANNLFIVFDDMLHDAQNWKNEKTVKNIFFNGRHYNFLFILTMQYAHAIPPALRSNIDYVFIFNEQSLKNRRRIYEDYAAMIPSFDHFCNILDACTQNYECLVVKTTGNSSDLRDNVFWYKAKSHENFRVGHYKFWKYHNSNYNKNYEEEHIDEEEKINELKDKFAKTKKLKVIVSRDNDKIIDIRS